jgi:hypothetical protein
MNSELLCADGASTMTQMVSTDDGQDIPATYGDFKEVFSNVKVETLLPQWSTNHSIVLAPSFNMPYFWMYNILEFELGTFKPYIDTNRPNGFIQRSS